MPAPGEIDVAHVARLARLNLTAEEAELFQTQLERILEYAGKLREADTTAVEVETETAEEQWRADEPRPWFTAEAALSNAPREANNLFIVPKVLE